MEENLNLNDLEEEEDKYMNNNSLFCSKKKLIYFLISILALSIIIFLILYFLIFSSTKSIKCEPGYFIPENKNVCKKCSLSNCNECHGTEDLNFCTSCISPYIPFYLNNSIYVCESPCQEGKGEKCLTCDKLKNQCLNCNKGYIFQEIVKIRINAKNVK